LPVEARQLSLRTPWRLTTASFWPSQRTSNKA
jgi:hypothetical protein